MWGRSDLTLLSRGHLDSVFGEWCQLIIASERNGKSRKNKLDAHISTGPLTRRKDGVVLGEKYEFSLGGVCFYVIPFWLNLSSMDNFVEAVLESEEFDLPRMVVNIKKWLGIFSLPRLSDTVILKVVHKVNYNEKAWVSTYILFMYFFSLIFQWKEQSSALKWNTTL